jgi:hypothetical protein
MNVEYFEGFFQRQFVAVHQYLPLFILLAVSLAVNAGRLATQAVEVRLERLLGAAKYHQLRESLDLILLDRESEAPPSE